jgi:hypothetical protein
MKKTILSVLAVFAAITLNAATTAVVNYDTVYLKWTESVAVSTQIKSNVDEVNAKLSVKTDLRAALIRQANEYASIKPADESQAKTLQTKFDTVKKQVEDLDKEITALQTSPELKKQINDQQTVLRTKVAEAVKAEADSAGVEVVLDSSALNAYGIPVVSGKVKDLTPAVLTKLEAKKTDKKADK